MIRVDGQLFIWMGAPGSSVAAVQKDMTVRISWFLGVRPLQVFNSLKFTATRTIFTMTCGSVDLIATFLTPIEVRPITSICSRLPSDDASANRFSEPVNSFLIP